MYKLIVFDLDGTLTESKQDIKEDMSELLIKLLQIKKVAIISGGSFSQFKNQFLSILESKNNININFNNLILLPQSGTMYYIHVEGDWVEKYNENFSTDEKEMIFKTFENVLDIKRDEKRYGSLFEDRGSQITFSALGQYASVEEKRIYDADYSIRRKIASDLRILLPDFDISIGGMTSIDITKLGRNKSFGIHKLLEYESCDIKEVLFIGDSLFEGGNDFPVISAGVDVISVTGSDETKEIIKDIINKYNVSKVNSDELCYNK
jgi:HAD superfamily hydrolase (TIGR01484 family)